MALLIGALMAALSASFVSSVLRLFIVGLLALMCFHLVRRAFIDRRMKMKGPATYWWNPFGVEIQVWHLLKQTPRTGEVLLSYLHGLCREYKDEPIFRGWLFHVPLVGVVKPEAAELILSSNNTIEKSQFYDLLHSWLGTGLLTSTGKKWHSRRKMLTPAFHFRILEDFLPIFNEQAIVLTKQMEDVGKHGCEFDVAKRVTDCTLDIICETAMGVQINAQGNPESEYVNAIYDLGERFLDRIAVPWLWPDPIFNMSKMGKQSNKQIGILHKFTVKVIHDRLPRVKAALEEASKQTGEGAVEGAKKRRPFLDLLLERHITSGDLSLKDIQEEVDTFMFEGHDTTAMGISWTLYLLAENIECQRKAQAEMDEIFGGDTERFATTDDLARMKYLECCIKESQRLFPSVPFIGRTIREDIHYKKKVIPAGATVAVLIYSMHRDPELYPDPERFDPDRFLPENCEKRHPYAYVPFSAGPRNCIGQKFAMNEEKVVISWVLRKLTLETTHRREDIHVLGELVTRSAGGLPVSAKPRKL